MPSTQARSGEHASPSAQVQPNAPGVQSGIWAVSLELSDSLELVVLVEVDSLSSDPVSPPPSVPPAGPQAASVRAKTNASEHLGASTLEG